MAGNLLRPLERRVHGVCPGCREVVEVFRSTGFSLRALGTSQHLEVGKLVRLMHVRWRLFLAVLVGLNREGRESLSGGI